MSYQLMFTLCFGRDLVDLNILLRSNVALKTPDEVRCWISLFPYWGMVLFRGVGVLVGSVVI